MSTAEEALSPSPGGKLSKLRIGRKKNDNDSSASLPSISPERDGSGRRMSVEGMIDKLRLGNRRSTDERRSSTDASRLLKLSSKLKRRKSDDGRENSTISNGSGDGIGRLSRQPSDQSLGLLASSRSSLLTEDSAESPGTQPVRPTLSPRDSHAGYLTVSSPLINARTTEKEVAATDLADSTAFTVPVSIIQEPQELPTVPSSDGQADSVSTSQAISHTDRLKGAFGGRKKVPGPDTVAVQSAPVVSGVGGLEGDQVKSEGRDPLVERENIQPFPSFKSTDNDKPVTPSKPSKAAAILSAIDTGKRPQTPPNVVQTPRTFVTPPTPTIPQDESPPKKPTSKTLQPNPPPTFGFRSRPKSASLSASKLSNSILSNPLTPPLEETKTPGGSLTQPSQGGFFSSWVSVAQNAANSITTTFNASPNQKSKLVEHAESADADEVIPGPEAQAETVREDIRPPAVETLGQGELNLSHLGITESAKPSPMSSATDLAGQGQQQNGETSLKAEEDAAARAVSVAYENPVISAVSQATGGRPASMVSSESNNEHSPPRTATFPPDAPEMKRSGSIRSKLSERKKRRHRASSATTGGTLAAAISASTSTITHPGATNGHKMTGFAVASSKRNKDFHQLFRSVPEDDYLIEDYSAALQRDILLHGRFYVSEGHICFSSNIFGWVTNLVIAFDEIVSVEKKNTAVVFPNAIVIQTLHARNVFASLVARDATYDLLIGIWKTSHPNLKSSINGVTLGDDGTGDKTEKADLTGSDDEESDEGSDDVYDEDAEDGEDFGSFTEAGANGSIAGSDIGDIAPVMRKASTHPVHSQVPSPGSGGPKGLEGADAVITGAAVAADFPGPPLHEPTECSDSSTHYDRPLIDTTIPAPLGKIYSIMFGPASGAFMKKWLVEDQQSREVVYDDDKIGLDDAHKTFSYSYIKPLNAPVGPKQTKCLVTANLLEYDLAKSISVDCSAGTPDVPSGNVFVTKTRYCLMWGPGNTTRFIATCTIEWSGKSWLKGVIEKGANDGQIQYVKDIVAAVKAAVTTKPPVKGQTRGKGKGRRRKETFDTTGAEAERASVSATKVEQAASWGPLEPVRGLLEPISSIVRPFVSTQLVIGILVLLLAQSWFFGSGRRSAGVGYPLTQPERLAAYEAMWQREEAELWNWLEGRVGLEDGIPQPRDSARIRQKAIKSNAMGRKLDQLVMQQGQAEDAIRVTGERLDALKEAWEKKKVNKVKS